MVAETQSCIGHRCEFLLAKLVIMEATCISDTICIAANLPTCLPVYLQNLHVLIIIIVFKSIQVAYVQMYICICIKKYVYIYYCIWLYVYTHLHCPHVHRSSNILNWASQSGTYWTWNDSLASPAKAASVASDQASCQRTIRFSGGLMDDLMIDGGWYGWFQKWGYHKMDGL